MNWPEFVAECEREMMEKGIKPDSVTMRVEVTDAFYDADVTPAKIGIATYDKTYLVINGD